tara:strand:+ start:1387 stop:2187 length:801 start_codon:yes stop_codon:yes gene_type:complete
VRRREGLRPVTTVAVGFVLGYLIGLTGVGGGALIAPTLYAILGLSYQGAIAVSLIYAVITKVISAVQHLRQGSVLWRVTLLYGVLGIPGAILGSRLVYWAGDAAEGIFPFIMAGMLALVASLIVWEAGAGVGGRTKPFSPVDLTARSVMVVAAVQFFVGILLGATSLGAGSFVILSMLYFFRMPARQVVGSNIVIAIFMGTPAWLTHYAVVGIDWNLLGLLMLGSVFGSVLGAKSTMLVPEQRLKQAVAGLIYIGAIATFIKAWTG